MHHSKRLNLMAKRKLHELLELKSSSSTNAHRNLGSHSKHSQ